MVFHVFTVVLMLVPINPSFPPFSLHSSLARGLVKGRPECEPVLVLHGGLGDGKWRVDDLAASDPRPLQDEYDPRLPTFVKQV